MSATTKKWSRERRDRDNERYQTPRVFFYRVQVSMTISFPHPMKGDINNFLLKECFFFAVATFQTSQVFALKLLDVEA